MGNITVLVGILALIFAVEAKADNDPKAGMQLLASDITALQKYLFSEPEFKDSKNEALIKKSLSSLDSHLQHLQKNSFAEDPALKVNLSLLRQHTSDANRAFENGNKAFSRYMLQSSLQLCIACHTRKNTSDFSWPEPEGKNIPAIDRADYLFATRQFKKGVEVYESVIERFPDNNESQWNLRKAALALAVYYARVTEDPQAGAKYFGRLAKKEHIPLYVRKELEAWSQEFTAWSKERKGKDPRKLTELELLAKTKKILRHDDFTIVSDLGRSFHVRRLRASTLLHRVLEAPGEKSPTKAEALLYLGQIYPKISSSLFFRFGEMYLKACITEYPKSSIARSCYVALELATFEGYSGSGGTNIPDSEQVELLRLKRIAN